MNFVTVLTVVDCSVEFYLCLKVGVTIVLAFCIYSVSRLDTLLGRCWILLLHDIWCDDMPWNFLCPNLFLIAANKRCYHIRVHL